VERAREGGVDKMWDEGDKEGGRWGALGGRGREQSGGGLGGLRREREREERKRGKGRK